MNRLIAPFIFIIALAFVFPIHAYSQYKSIYSGITLFDTNGNIINAHGGCIVKENNTFYLFGECHTDTSNAFIGFNCYSSTDLYNWKFERRVLKIQKNGFLGPNRIGERVKVMKCPTTGKFVMYMHTDDLRYKDPNIGYATATQINGDYTFNGALLFNDKPIKKWDMGTFQDTDGTGYLITHGGNIYKLTDDYTGVADQILKDMTKESESPAIFKKDSTYFWLASNRTSWERNDNFYFTATSLKGPWTSKGHFAPEGTLTWNAQTTFVLPIIGSKATTYLFMGDRWSYPKQATAATYVWQPLTVSGTTLSIPQFIESWQIDVKNGQWMSSKISGKPINKQHFNDTLQQYIIKGNQVFLYGKSDTNCGYAQISLMDKHNKILFTTTVDFYSKYANDGLKFISPLLNKATYTLKINTLGEHGNWSDKTRTIYGSTGNKVPITKIMVAD